MITKILNTRLTRLVEEKELLNQSQIGFRPNQGTRQGVFTIGTLIEKAKAKKIPMVLTFVDLSAAYDSVNRQALFKAMNALGLGGKVQQVIGSLYQNDRIIFEVNNSTTKPLFLTQGVRQGCNLSPILFNILLKQVADQLQESLTGVELDGEVISILLYADDICLISSSAKMAKEAYGLLVKACDQVGMKVNQSKSQIVKKGDKGMAMLKDIPLEQVIVYKYLGVLVEIGRGQYMTRYSESRANKANTFVASTISLARNSPCPALFAWRVWRLVALPAILYGCETVLIRKRELDDIEKAQSRVAKFILQVEQCTCNVVAQVLADFELVEVVYWRRVLNFYADLHLADEDTWAKKAFNEAIEMEDQSNYISKIKFMLNILEVEGPKDLEEKLSRYAARKTNEELRNRSTTCFALSMVTATKPTLKSPLFGSDYISKTYHEFITLNAQLGNRKPLDGYPRFVTCPICTDKDNCMNELHMLMLCSSLEEEREKQGIRLFLDSRSEISEVTVLYRDYWRNTANTEILRIRVEAAANMREAFLDKLGRLIIFKKKKIDYNVLLNVFDFVPI